VRRLVLTGDLSLDGYLGRDGLDPRWWAAYDDHELVAYRQRVLDKAGVHASGGAWDVATLVGVKQDGGHQEWAPVVVEGGPELCHELTGRGLVDEYRIFVHPVVLGDGHRFFAAEERLMLIATRFFSTGSMGCTYVPVDAYRDLPPPLPWAEGPDQDQQGTQPEQPADRPPPD
jgi:hypothetical protein